MTPGSPRLGQGGPVLAAGGALAGWEPIDDRVTAMAGIEDRHRNLMVDGVPVATGVVAVGDGWACSNPTVGTAAAVKDPDCLQGFVSVTMVLSRATGVAAQPGLLDKVIALGAGWRDEPILAPGRVAVHRRWRLGTGL